MTELQAADIIDNHFKAHWSTWKFPPQETKFWVKHLVKFDFNKAVSAIEKLYASQEKQRKPAPAVVLAVLYKKAFIQTDKDLHEMIPLFTIMRPDGRRKFFPFCGPRETTVEEIEEQAQYVCRYCNGKEEGHYIQYHVKGKEE